MARKITTAVCSAFLNGTAYHAANSATDGRTLLLHGNRIAWKGQHNGADGVFITCAGWGTPTTRERLNGVLAAMGHHATAAGPDGMLHVRQRDGAQQIACNGSPRVAELGTDGVAFIAHPVTARGMAAVAIIDPPCTVEGRTFGGNPFKGGC